MNMIRMKNKGFTLIELLVVIAIIGILSSVVLASLNTARQKGRDARRISDVKQIQLALELYYDSNQFYPLTIGTTASSVLITGSYISSIPVDPVSNVTYSYAPLATAGATTAATACSSSSVCASYVLLATLENTTNTVLSSDVDTGLGALTCTDPAYCVTP
ncbi:MAG: type II secretion system protein [bacterium]|nr:type II secretion system protein [bacterium]